MSPIGTTYANDVETTIKIRAINCCECGLTFGISATFEQFRREDKRSFYCPNGHSQFFPGKTEAEIAQAERDAARELAARESNRRRLAEKEAAHERRVAAAHKGWNTRIRNRIANGVCPCCNRSFTNVRRHMETQHPDFQIPAVD